MRMLFLGHSHLGALIAANESQDLVDAEFIGLRGFKEAVPPPVLARLAERDDAPVVFCLHGNAHNVVTLSIPPEFRTPGAAPAYIARNLGIQLRPQELVLHRFRAASTFRREVVVCPPPPLPEDHVLLHPAQFRERFDLHGVSPTSLRVDGWRMLRYQLLSKAETAGMIFVDAPAEAIDEDGLLQRRYCGRDPVHANAAYGALVLRDVARALGVPLGARSVGSSPRNPYLDMPRSNWWSSSVTRVRSTDVDPVVRPKFRITRSDRIVTAGSCFAQHVAKRLARHGFNYLVTEQAPEGMGAEEATRANYGVFSARYGNVYTARQFDQLIDRAYGRFRPVDDVWETGGRFYDPFRPQIQEGGFVSREALETDREAHFAAVRRALEGADVLVFTLGLTETWYDKRDGAVYPTVPGAVAGAFDPAVHGFHNFNVEEVVRDLTSAIGKIRAIRPGVRILLTVSPVPLKATASEAHVLVATTYSKSVLRVAAEQICEMNPRCDYFPSYEIITGQHARGAYYERDLREITRDGVDHVMRVLFAHYAVKSTAPTRRALAPAAPDMDHVAEMARLGEIVCDEEVLDRLNEHRGARDPARMLVEAL